MTGLRWQDMMSNTRNSLNETLSGVPERKAVNCRILIYDSSLRVIYKRIMKDRGDCYHKTVVIKTFELVCAQCKSIILRS